MRALLEEAKVYGKKYSRKVSSISICSISILLSKRIVFCIPSGGTVDWLG